LDIGLEAAPDRGEETAPPPPHEAPKPKPAPEGRPGPGDRGVTGGPHAGAFAPSARIMALGNPLALAFGAATA
jgi:hypothetical protein